MRSESMVEGDMHVKGDDGNLKRTNNCSKHSLQWCKLGILKRYTKMKAKTQAIRATKHVWIYHEFSSMVKWAKVCGCNVFILVGHS